VEQFAQGGGLRLALSNNCTTGNSDPTYCKDDVITTTTTTDSSSSSKHAAASSEIIMVKPHHDRKAYTKLLSQHAGVYPGSDAKPKFTFPGSRRFDSVTGEIVDSDEQLTMIFDWDPKWFFQVNTAIVYV
jgi:hypothetical protein